MKNFAAGLMIMAVLSCSSVRAQDTPTVVYPKSQKRWKIVRVVVGTLCEGAGIAIAMPILVPYVTSHVLIEAGEALLDM